ncbi:MBL fold metallo-hydrolase [Mariprofundus erugo]|nr:MBL fold metallo-hydrolase [Mariprofundus erugo]
MIRLNTPRLMTTLSMLVLLQGCMTTSHPTARSGLGISTGSDAMEQRLEQPGPIRLESIDSADWQGPLSGMLNLDSPAAREAGLTDRSEPTHIYVYLLTHPKFGHYLIDTGVSETLLADPGKEGLNWLIRKVMHLDHMHIKTGTGEILQQADGELSGIFLSHLHLDHIMGMTDIPAHIPLYAGSAEPVQTGIKNFFTRNATDQLLEKMPPLQLWQFQPDPQHRFEGIMDVFGDGSLFVISVPGHTAGSTAFLIRTTHGPVLLSGDTCITRWGWEHATEPGDFTSDHAENLKNLQRLQALVARHPQIEVHLGHQP